MQPGIIEQLLVLRNQEYLAAYRRCENCNRLITRAQWFSEDCPKADNLKGIGHVLKEATIALCEMDNCSNAILGSDSNLATVDGALLLVCDGCLEELMEVQTRGKQE